MALTLSHLTDRPANKQAMRGSLPPSRHNARKMESVRNYPPALNLVKLRRHPESVIIFGYCFRRRMTHNNTRCSNKDVYFASHQPNLADTCAMLLLSCICCGMILDQMCKRDSGAMKAWALFCASFWSAEIIQLLINQVRYQSVSDKNGHCEKTGAVISWFCRCNNVIVCSETQALEK